MTAPIIRLTNSTAHNLDSWLLLDWNTHKPLQRDHTVKSRGFKSPTHPPWCKTPNERAFGAAGRMTHSKIEASSDQRRELRWKWDQGWFIYIVVPESNLPPRWSILYHIQGDTGINFLKPQKGGGFLFIATVDLGLIFCYNPWKCLYFVRKVGEFLFSKLMVIQDNCQIWFDRKGLQRKSNFPR